MENIGYIRVSTEEQNTARQEEALSKYRIDRMYVEKISGKNTNRPELKKLLGYVREGDTVIVESYSRFSRNTKDLCSHLLLTLCCIFSSLFKCFLL